MKTRTLWTIAITLLMVLGACSRSENDVLRTIPADAEMVAKMDLNAILNSAGCKEEGGKWVLGSELESLSKDMKDSERATMQGVLDALQAVDMENIFLFSFNRDMYLTCGLKHADALAAELEKEYGAPVSFDGLKVYDGTFAIRDNQMWITERTDRIADVLKSASKSSMATQEAVAKNLCANDADISVATNYASSLRNVALLMPGFQLPDELNNSFAVYKLHFDGNSARFEGCVIDAKGNSLAAADHMKPIGGTVCGFMPAAPIAAMAMGQFDDTVMDVMTSIMPGYLRAQVAEVLDAIDGSIGFGVAAPTDFANLLQPELWTFTLAVQCKKDKAEQLLELLPMLAQNANAIVTQHPDQLQMCVKGGFRQHHDLNAYVGYFDGTLVASTHKISADSNSGLSKQFGNYYFASMADVPASGDIVNGLGLPFGITAERHTGNDKSIGAATLDGSDRPFLAAIIGAITDHAMHRRVGENIGRLAE